MHRTGCVAPQVPWTDYIQLPLQRAQSPPPARVMALPSLLLSATPPRHCGPASYAIASPVKKEMVPVFTAIMSGALPESGVHSNNERRFTRVWSLDSRSVH